MPLINCNRTKSAAAVLVILLASLVLAACGGSSKGSSSSTRASASTAPPGGVAGAPGGRFVAMRECLQKHGVTLPKRTPGQRRPPARGGFLGGGAGPRLPAGVTRAQFQAALRKCGGFAGFRGRGRRLDSPAYRQALTKFAGCMRSNGVNVPPPNTSGNGPIFNSRGLNTNSARFRTAQAKCQKILAEARPAGGPGPGPAGAAPPSPG